MVLSQIGPRERAIEIASFAETVAIERHQGKKYGPSDRDVVEAHIRPVVEFIARLGYGHLIQAAAWLHDSGEDTGYTPEMMYADGFPDLVVRPVDLLTKRPGQDYGEYRYQVVQDPRAVVIKFGDSVKNLGNTCMMGHELDDETFVRNVDRYTTNIEFFHPYVLPPDHPVFAEG